MEESTQKPLEQTVLQEAEYANQLELDRGDVQEQADTILQEGKSFGRPSLIRYFVLLFVFAVPNDVIDVLLEPTLLGAPLAWFVSFFISVLSILFCWFTDHEQKRANGYMKRLES
ncbi:MAG: hypothetical protein Q8Q92_02385, partial [bacterium]|nr:hypothetical protein [bacterium]